MALNDVELYVDFFYSISNALFNIPQGCSSNGQGTYKRWELVGCFPHATLTYRFLYCLGFEDTGWSGRGVSLEHKGAKTVAAGCKGRKQVNEKSSALNRLQFASASFFLWQNVFMGFQKSRKLWHKVGPRNNRDLNSKKLLFLSNRINQEFFKIIRSKGLFLLRLSVSETLIYCRASVANSLSYQNTIGNDP